MSQPQTTPYLDSLSTLKLRFPYTYSLDKGMKSWSRQVPCTSAVLKFFPEADHPPRHDFKTADELKRYLETRSQTSCTRHLYIIEDLSDMVEVIGSQFWIDPYIFACQDQAALWGEMPKILPSTQSLNSTFTLRYHEVLSIAVFWTSVADETEFKTLLGEPHKAGQLLEKIWASYWLNAYDLIWTNINQLEVDLRAIQKRSTKTPVEIIDTLRETFN